jgi:hypothetical protein
MFVFPEYIKNKERLDYIVTSRTDADSGIFLIKLTSKKAVEYVQDLSKIECHNAKST